jgi:hypothetical protein
MKSRDWQRFLEDQRRRYGKRFFTLTELANVADASRAVIKVEVGRMAQQGVIVRYSRGNYGLPDTVRPEELLPELDPSAYITGAYALNRHSLVTQVPTEITCFTNRRHNLSRVRQTPSGRFVFVCVSARIYSPPAADLIATPTQALCDFVYLACRHGLDPQTLATFRRMDRIAEDELARLLPRYPNTVARAVRRIQSASQVAPA